MRQDLERLVLEFAERRRWSLTNSEDCADRCLCRSEALAKFLRQRGYSAQVAQLGGMRCKLAADAANCWLDLAQRFGVDGMRRCATHYVVAVDQKWIVDPTAAQFGGKYLGKGLVRTIQSVKRDWTEVYFQ